MDMDGGPYIFVWIDALTQKVREDAGGWLAFLRGLVDRGLSGVEMVISDCHAGLRDAIASVLPALKPLPDEPFETGLLPSPRGGPQRADYGAHLRVSLPAMHP